MDPKNMSRHGNARKKRGKGQMRGKNLSNTFGNGYTFKTISCVET
jgi:hypothetical protein